MKPGTGTLNTQHVLSTKNRLAPRVVKNKPSWLPHRLESDTQPVGCSSRTSRDVALDLSFSEGATWGSLVPGQLGLLWIGDVEPSWNKLKNPRRLLANAPKCRRSS